MLISCGRVVDTVPIEGKTERSSKNGPLLRSLIEEWTNAGNTGNGEKGIHGGGNGACTLV